MGLRWHDGELASVGAAQACRRGYGSDMSVAKSERGGVVKRAASLPGPEARQVLLGGSEANSSGENSAAAILGLRLRC